MDRAIDRAFAGMKELLNAHMETIGAELSGINRRLDEQAAVQGRVEDHESRLVAAEAFIHSQEKRLGESRAYRKIHLPTIAIALAAVIVAVLALVF